MGDSIMGLSTLQWLKEAYPEAKLVYGLPSWIIPLYKNVKTAADEYLNVDLKSSSDWLRLRKELKAISPDHIHELHLAGRTQKFFKLYSLFNKATYSFHNHHLKAGTDVHDQGVIKSLIQRDLDGAWSFLGREKSIPSFEDYEPQMRAEGITQKDQYVLGVVATRETKMWPLEYYAELSRKLSGKVLFPLSKSPTDLEIRKKLEAMNLPSHVEFVHAPLEELPLILAGSKAYIGNDTGLKHLCIALGVKTWTFFGPEPPLEWHPYKTKQHKYFYIEPLECRTREAHYCGLSTCDSMICLNQINVEQVYKEIQK
jgi:heptosyltransferase-2